MKATLWSAAARRRFGPRRLDAAFLTEESTLAKNSNSHDKNRRQAAADQSGVEPPHSKEFTEVNR